MDQFVDCPVHPFACPGAVERTHSVQFTTNVAFKHFFCSGTTRLAYFKICASHGSSRHFGGPTAIFITNLVQKKKYPQYSIPNCKIHLLKVFKSSENSIIGPKTWKSSKLCHIQKHGSEAKTEQYKRIFPKFTDAYIALGFVLLCFRHQEMSSFPQKID